MDKVILVTGFEPFGGDEINPSWEAVRRLPDHLEDWEIRKRCLPVVYGKAPEIVIKEAEEGKPQMILCTGLASGREQMTPEMIGINLRSAKSPDNSGTVLRDVKINEDGPDGIFSDLPVRAMEKALKEAGIPAAISLSAGSYVCNDVLYSLLDHFSKSPTRCGFVHMPPQEKIPPETAARGLLCCLEAMIREC